MKLVSLLRLRLKNNVLFSLKNDKTFRAVENFPQEIKAKSGKSSPEKLPSLNIIYWWNSHYKNLALHKIMYISMENRTIRNKQ